MTTPVELSLISKIIEDGDYRTPRRFGLSTLSFKSTDAREMFRTIHNHFHNKNHFGRVPTADHMKREHPVFKQIGKSKETMAELCEELRTKAMTRELMNGLEDAMDLLETKKPDEVLTVVHEFTSRIGRYTPKIRGRMIHESAEEFLEWYEGQKAKEVSYGIPWPWAELTAATQGIDKDDLIILFGRPKSMKSFIAGAVIANNFYKHGLKTLIYSCEMRTEKFERRLWSALARVDYARMKAGELDAKSDKRLLRVVNGVRSGEFRRGDSTIRTVPISDCPEGMNPLTHLTIELESFQPDLTLVDSFYRMLNTREWAKQSDLVQALKSTTSNLETPIIATTQGTRLKNVPQMEESKEEHLEDIAYTDAIGQEADLIIRARKEGRYADRSRLIKLSLAGSRESEEEGGSLYLHVKPSTMFKVQEWREAAVTMAEGDVIDEDTKSNGKSKGKRGPTKKDRKLKKQVERTADSVLWEGAEDLDMSVVSGVKR